MRALVTGCAGFIGSHLTDRLIKDGYEVIGIDCFKDYYPRGIKEKNIKNALGSDKFTLIEEDILDISKIADSSDIGGVDYVFHQAAQAGVRTSWGNNFSVYTKDNIEATQKLLEFYKDKDIKRFVYASSSSVYGDTTNLPMKETAGVQPVSPYGVTKLAAEYLCNLYWTNYKVPTVTLRYFTVYGPRQRPDMGINKFVKAIISGGDIVVYGDGSQTRDFTYVDDIVEANILAARADQKKVAGEVINIGGGERISVTDLINVLIDIYLNTELGNVEEKSMKASGQSPGIDMHVHPHVSYSDNQKGDVRDTWADTSKAKDILSWCPKTGIEEGLKKYFDWYCRA